MRWPSLLAMLWLPATWACGSDALPPPPPPPPPQPVVSVVVVPASADLTVGDTLRLRAEPRDSAGNPLAGRRVAWDAAAPSIASVDTTGLVRAAGPGATVVLAMSEGRAGVARLTVQPPPPPPPPPPAPVASLQIRPDSAGLLAGDRLQLDAEPRDSAGNLLQRLVTWASADPAIATVDSAGLVRGVYPGRAQITATSESVADSAGVTVAVLACSEVDTTAAFAQEARQRFLVALRSGDPGTVLGYSPGRVYSTALNGFAAELTATEIATLRRDPRVRAIAPDGQAWTQENFTSLRRVEADTQFTSTPWGIDRVDARLGLDGTYSWTADGRGVTAYIIDTGILEERTEFEGRAVRGPFILPDSVRGDCHGHGTHVAGIVGSKTYGVAKRVTLVGVRVLNCLGFGWWSDIAAGLDWVAQQPLPAVANMSLGGPVGSAETIMEIALRGLRARGVSVIVAAGNSGNDACTFTPARIPEALTVAATFFSPDSIDIRPWWSNFGECVDLFAPGLQIPSVSIADDDRAFIASGTSMATPHVTGVAALILSAFPTLTPAQVETMILDATTRDVVLLAESPNRLLYSRLGLPSPPPDPPPPPPPPPPDIASHVGALAGTRDTLDRVGEALIPRWRATATVEAHEPGHGPLGGVTVTGRWGRLDLSAECVTGADGQCQVVSPPISCAVPGTSLAVTGLRGARVVYDVRANDVSAEVRVARP